MAVNPDKLNAFTGKTVGDIGAALSANMMRLGDRIGLYKAMVNAGSHDSSERHKRRSMLVLEASHDRYDNSVRRTNLRTAVHLLDRRR